MTIQLSLKSVDKFYGPVGKGVHAVKDITMDVPKGDIIALLGSSGCGKTSTLRMIAGFEAVSRGTIELAGKQVQTLPPVRRNVAMAFEGYSLYPTVTVRDNIAFALKASRLAEAEVARRVGHVAEMLEITDILDRFPFSISGGQQQRASLARALVRDADLHLLDEPMGQLEPQLRTLLRGRIKHYIKERGLTAILVTHDQHEAFSMADRIGVMNAGELQQWGSSYSLYHQPNSRMVADFIGQGVFLPGQKTGNGLQIELAHIVLPEDQLPASEHFDVLIRPDDIIHDNASPMQAKVVRKAFRGADFLYTLELDSGVQVLALVPSHHNHAIGEPIGIKLELDHVITFERT